MNYRLILQDMYATQHNWELRVGQTLLIGRSPMSDISLHHPTISRSHCTVSRDEQGVWVRDHGSRNGTFIGETFLTPNETRPLRIGDVLRITRVSFRLGGSVVVNPHWLQWNDGVVRKLALHIRRESDNAALPVLADALEDAGCDDEELLAHLRDQQLQDRRYWLLDVLLPEVPHGSRVGTLEPLEMDEVERLSCIRKEPPPLPSLDPGGETGMS